MAGSAIGRRLLIGAAGAVGASAIGAGAFAAAAGWPSDYAAATGALWRLPARPAPDAVVPALVRLALLAPNSHNTQPWRFAIDADRIRILPDLTRRCPAVDPDNHHLFVSLGAAAETIVQAAPLYGRAAEAAFDPAAGGSVQIDLRPMPWRLGPEPTPLAAAIVQRQTTRGEYDGYPVPTDQLDLLESAGRGDGVATLLLTDKRMRERVLEYVVAGLRAQAGDPAFVAELERWLRFSYRQALATGDGLFTACTGNPVVPEWVGRALFRRVDTASSEARRVTGQIRSSAGIAVLSTDADDPERWVAAGRAFQRFALQATALGLKLAPINAPVEVAALRPGFVSLLGLSGRRPDMVVRFGNGPSLPRSLRRGLAEVLA